MRSLTTVTYKKGDVIFRQGDMGDAIYFLDVGECVAKIQLLSFEVGERVEHKTHGEGTVMEVTTDPNTTRVVFDKKKEHSDKKEEHTYTISSYHKLKRPSTEVPVEPKYQEVARYRPITDGEYQPFFGEACLIKTEPRPRNLTVTCVTDVTVWRLEAPTFLKLKLQQDRHPP